MKKIKCHLLIILIISVITLMLIPGCVPELADITAPTVSIIHPSDGSNVSGIIQIVVSASDDGTVKEMQVFLDGIRLSKTGKSFLSYSWDTATITDNLQHYISAIAIDESDNIGTAPIITVTTVQGDITPPAVNIISPTDGQTVNGNVTIIADATDDSQVERVEFYIDGSAVDTVFSSPYDYLWKTSSNDIGIHTIFARAYDLSSNTAISPVITVAVDTTNIIPRVTILNPLDGQIVSGTVNISADANDDDGIERVEFYIDGLLEQTVFTPPYNYLWDTDQVNAGDHNIFAKAFDLNTNSGTSPVITVTVDTLIDDIPPVVNIINPPNGQIVTGNVNIFAEATDNDAVERVEFFIDGLLIETVFTPPYDYLWNTSSVNAGDHNIYARAFDLSGNSDVSPVITVTVDTLIDNIPPVVNIINPPNGQIVSGNVNIFAEATDNVQVDRVEFFIDGFLESTASSPPWDYLWNTALADTGIHNIFARAFDLSNNSAVSPTITVTVTQALAVGNISPKVKIVSPSRNGIFFTESESKLIPIEVTSSKGATIGRVEFYIDGKLQKVVTRATGDRFKYDWDIEGLGDGLLHTIFVKGIDELSNSTADMIVVRVYP